MNVEFLSVVEFMHVVEFSWVRAAGESGLWS